MVYAAGGSEGRIHALQSVDLDVASGEFVSLIGPSGCGKSTLLRLIGDLLAPTSGSIQVNGKAPRQARLSRETSSNPPLGRRMSSCCPPSR